MREQEVIVPKNREEIIDLFIKFSVKLDENRSAWAIGNENNQKELRKNGVICS